MLTVSPIGSSVNAGFVLPFASCCQGMSRGRDVTPTSRIAAFISITTVYPESPPSDLEHLYQFCGAINALRTYHAAT